MLKLFNLKKFLKYVIRKNNINFLKLLYFFILINIYYSSIISINKYSKIEYNNFII